MLRCRLRSFTASAFLHTGAPVPTASASTSAGSATGSATAGAAGDSDADEKLADDSDARASSATPLRLVGRSAAAPECFTGMSTPPRRAPSGAFGSASRASGGGHVAMGRCDCVCVAYASCSNSVTGRQSSVVPVRGPCPWSLSVVRVRGPYPGSLSGSAISARDDLCPCLCLA